MVGATVAFALQLSILAGSPTYQTALKDAQEQQRPLLVLVGAPWCPGCQVMKTRVIPELEKGGGLKEVSFAIVDYDAERDTATQLMRGGTIPQLIVFSKRPDGQWHREQITGETNEAQVKSLIARAVKEQAPADRSERTASTGSAVGN
jgi:thioredoxin-like negative regulator of GroEL